MNLNTTLQELYDKMWEAQIMDLISYYLVLYFFVSIFQIALEIKLEMPDNHIRTNPKLALSSLLLFLFGSVVNEIQSRDVDHAYLLAACVMPIIACIAHWTLLGKRGFIFKANHRFFSAAAKSSIRQRKLNSDGDPYRKYKVDKDALTKWSTRKATESQPAFITLGINITVSIYVVWHLYLIDLFLGTISILYAISFIAYHWGIAKKAMREGSIRVGGGESFVEIYR